MSLSQAERAEMFVCGPLRARLSRGACAARHEHWSRRRSPSMAANDGVTACACRRCPIGAKHARGQLADVELVQLKSHATGARLPTKRCLGCGEPLPPPRPREPGHASYPQNVHGPACWSAVNDFRTSQHMQPLEWA